MYDPLLNSSSAARFENEMRSLHLFESKTQPGCCVVGTSRENISSYGKKKTIKKVESAVCETLNGVKNKLWDDSHLHVLDTCSPRRQNQPESHMHTCYLCHLDITTICSRNDAWEASAVPTVSIAAM